MAEKLIQRIDGILKLINRIENEIGEISFEDFQKTALLQEAISFSISQIGERMNKLEELLGEKYPKLPWKEARKMRNLIVHDYDSVDFSKVYLTARDDLPVLKKELLSIKYDINKINIRSLESERLFLRPWDDFDADELFELAKEDEIGYWCGWAPHRHIRDTFFALHNFLEVDEVYAICLKENNKIIGSVGLDFKSNLNKEEHECELGFWIGKPYWNNGYASEAANRVIEHAFKELNIKRIWCGHFDGNERSKRVQENLGFQYHHTDKNKKVPELCEYRVAHVYVLDKSIHNPDVW